MSAAATKTAEAGSRHRRPAPSHPLVALMGESSDEAEANAEEAQRVRRLLCARPRWRAPTSLQAPRAPALTALWSHAQTVSLGKQMGLSLAIPKERGTGGRPALRLTSRCAPTWRVRAGGVASDSFESENAIAAGGDASFIVTMDDGKEVSVAVAVGQTVEFLKAKVVEKLGLERSTELECLKDGDVLLDPLSLNDYKIAAGDSVRLDCNVVPPAAGSS